VASVLFPVACVIHVASVLFLVACGVEEPGRGHVIAGSYVTSDAIWELETWYADGQRDAKTECGFARMEESIAWSTWKLAQINASLDAMEASRSIALPALQPRP
jgi:hypothetical protein